MLTVAATTTDSHHTLTSGLSELRFENAKTIARLEEIRSGLTPISTELRSLRSLNNKILPESEDEYHMVPGGTRAEISDVSGDIAGRRPSIVGSPSETRGTYCASTLSAFSLRSSQAPDKETSSCYKPLQQALVDMENVTMDVRDQQDRQAKRNRSEQAQQFLQLQKGIGRTKGIFQAIKAETHDFELKANLALSLRSSSTSVRRADSMELKQLVVLHQSVYRKLIAFVELAFRNLHSLLLLVFP